MGPSIYTARRGENIVRRKLSVCVEDEMETEGSVCVRGKSIPNGRHAQEIEGKFKPSDCCETVRSPRLTEKPPCSILSSSRGGPPPRCLSPAGCRSPSCCQPPVEIFLRSNATDIPADHLQLGLSFRAKLHLIQIS